MLRRQRVSSSIAAKTSSSSSFFAVSLSKTNQTKQSCPTSSSSPSSVCYTSRRFCSYHYLHEQELEAQKRLKQEQRELERDEEAADMRRNAAAVAAKFIIPPIEYQDQMNSDRQHPPIMNADRMIVIRHLLEGRDPAGVPPQKFGGFFEDPNAVPGSYELTVRDLENLITELFSHRTVDELNLPEDENDVRYDHVEREQESQYSPTTNEIKNERTSANDDGAIVAEINSTDDIDMLQAQSFNSVIQQQKNQQHQHLSKLAHKQAVGDTTTPAVSSMESPHQRQLIMTAEKQRQEEEAYLHQGAEGLSQPPPLHNFDLPDELQERTPHPSTRSDIVSDSVERRLLLAYAVFKYNFILEPPGATEPTDRTANPKLYMKLVADGIGYTISRNILQDILVNEHPMHPEVLRYLVELALVLKDNDLLTDCFKFAEGEYATLELQRNFIEKAMKQEPGVYETQRDLCFTSIMTSCSEYIFKNCMIAVLEGEGEGDAVRTAFDSIKVIVPRLPNKDLQAAFLRHIEDQVQLMFQDAIERRSQIYESGGIDGDVELGTGNLREAEVDYLESSAETIVQAAAAVMKAVVGTEVATVIDHSGALHFELCCSLYGSMRGLGRTSEACGIGESTLKFYEEHRETLTAENKRRHQERVETEKIMMLESGNNNNSNNRTEEGGVVDFTNTNENNDNNSITPASSRNVGNYNALEDSVPGRYYANTREAYEHHFGGDRRNETERQRELRQRRQRAVSLEFNSDDPQIEKDSFEFLYRNVYYHYLTDRARTDPKSGLHNILAACEKHPKSSEIFRLLSMCLFRLERWDESLAAIDRSILLNPLNPHCHKLRSHILYKLKEYLTAERENYLSNVLHDCWDGLRAPLTPQDVLHATGTLLVEADQRHQALKKELYKEHNGDPNNKPQWPDSMENALQLSELKDPATGAIITAEASSLLTELVNIQLPDTDEEMRFYLDQMRRHHIYSKQGKGTPRLKDVRVSDLYDLISEANSELGIKKIEKDHFDQLGRA